MNIHSDKVGECDSQSPASEVVQAREGSAPLQFANHRSDAASQRKLQQMANLGPSATNAQKVQLMANHAHDRSTHPVQKKENKTGLPDALKSGIERLSGYSMDDVKVHYNSNKPAQLSALACAQGADIHVAPGQERHLPHEAWHVVQQAQGRVRPTMQMKGGVPVHDDKSLEHEADVMGAKAISVGVAQGKSAESDFFEVRQPTMQLQFSPAVQRLKIEENPDKKDDAKVFFRIRYGQGDATNGLHNYAFMNGVTDQWAKSSGSGHAEAQLAGLYAQDGVDLHIVSELQPCAPCREYLPKVEEARGMRITVYYNLPHEDSGDGNKAQILEMYKEYKWLSRRTDTVTEILKAGKVVLGIE